MSIQSYKSIVLCTAALTLSACATLSPEECQHANWYEIGRSDAINGHQVDRLATHRKSCAKAGFPVGSDSYYAGHEKGLELYCTEDAAFNAARNGQQRPPQCISAPYAHPAFAEAYRYGLTVREQELSISANYRSISALQKEIAAAKKRIAEIETILGSRQLENYEAIALHEESIELQQRIPFDEESIAELQRQIPPLQEELEAMQQRFLDRSYLETAVQTIP